VGGVLQVSTGKGAKPKGGKKMGIVCHTTSRSKRIKKMHNELLREKDHKGKQPQVHIHVNKRLELPGGSVNYQGALERWAGN